MITKLTLDPLFWHRTTYNLNILILSSLFPPSEISVVVQRSAERQTAGMQPIIRNEKGMNCKASFH